MKTIFIHICKCGGSTITSILRSQKKLWRRKSNDIGFEWEQEYNALITNYNHFTIEAARKEIDPCIFEKSFKFTFVRNPWARLVSAYHYGALTNARSFDQFVKNINEYVNIKKTLKTVHVLNCLDWISDDKGNVLVDFIGKIENLQEDFNVVCDKIGIPQQQLPHKNKSNHKHYTEYYDDETREIVAEKYANDIEYFNYEFGK